MFSTTTTINAIIRSVVWSTDWSLFCLLNLQFTGLVDFLINTAFLQIIVRNCFLVHVINCWHYKNPSVSYCVQAYFTFLWTFGLKIKSFKTFLFLKQTLFSSAHTQIDNLLSNQRISPFSYGSVHETKKIKNRAEAISGQIISIWQLCHSMWFPWQLGEASNKTNLSCHFFT